MVFIEGIGNVEYDDNLGGKLAVDENGNFYTEFEESSPLPPPAPWEDYSEEDAEEAHGELLGGVESHRYDRFLGRRGPGSASYVETSEAGERGFGDDRVEHLKPTDTTLERIESGELDEGVALRSTPGWGSWLFGTNRETAYRPESVKTSEWSEGRFAGSGGLTDEELWAMSVTRSRDIATKNGTAPREGDEGYDIWVEEDEKVRPIAERAYQKVGGDAEDAAKAGMDLADFREDQRLQGEAEGRSEGMGWVAPVYYGFEDLSNTLLQDGYRFASTVEWIGGDTGLDEHANELQRMRNLEERVRGKGREGGGETYAERTYRQAGTELVKYVAVGLTAGAVTRNAKAAEGAVMAFAASESFNQQYVESIDQGHGKAEATMHGAVKAGITAVSMYAGNRLGRKLGMGPMDFAGVNIARRLIGKEAADTALDLSTKKLSQSMVDFSFSVAKGGVGEVAEESADMLMGMVYDRMAYKLAGRELGAGAEGGLYDQLGIAGRNFIELLGPSLAGGGAGKLMPGGEAYDNAVSGVRAILESVDENYRNIENEMVGRRQASQDIAKRLGIISKDERGVGYDELHRTILSDLKSTKQDVREGTIQALKDLEDMRLPKKPSRKDFTDKTGRKESSRSQREGYDQEVATVLRHGEAFEHIFEERSYEEVMEDILATHPDLVEEYAERKAAIKESEDAVERRERLLEELEVMQVEDPDLADSLRESALAHVKETAPKDPSPDPAKPTPKTKKASAGVDLTIQEQIKQQARPVTKATEHRDDILSIQKAIPGAQIEQVAIPGEGTPSGGFRAYRWRLMPGRKKKGEKLKENTGIVMWVDEETAKLKRGRGHYLGHFKLNTNRITLDGLGVVRLNAALDNADQFSTVGGKAVSVGIEETLRHELVHLARAGGLFTDKEWSGLVKKYSDPSKSELGQEEDIARASALWERDSGFRNGLKQFLRKIIEAIRGLGGRESSQAIKDEVAATEQAFLAGEVLKRNRIAEDSELIALWRNKLGLVREEGKRIVEGIPKDTPAADIPTEVIVDAAADVVAGRDPHPKVQKKMFEEPEVMEARIENAAKEMSDPSPEPEATDAPFDVETMEDLLASGSYLHPRANLDKKPPKRRRGSSGRKFHAEIMDMLTRGIETGEAIEKGFPNAAKKMRSAGFEPQEVVDYVNHQRAEGRSQHDWEAVPYEAPPKPRAPERVEVASLPKGLSSAKPRYNMGSKSYQPKFASDVDLALYIVARTGSKRDADYMKWLKEVFPGRGVTEIRELGAGVRQHLRSIAQESEPGAIDIPESRISMDTHPDLDEGVMMAAYGPLRKRVKSGESKGQYIGAPKGIDTPGKLATILNRVRRLAEEGVYGRFWYERSGRSILEFVHGDKQEAEKVVAAIAVTSPNTPVASNFTFALQAYTQWKAGREIRTGKFPTAMSAKLKGIFEGKDWAGRKTNEFYGNLMRVVDPSRVQGVTTDIWMQRAFGHYQDSPTDAQYTFSENEVKRIAGKLGWEPQQVQAAAWVAMKSRMENPEVKAATNKESLENGYIKFSGPKKELKTLNGEAHRRVWYKHALKHRPTDKDRAEAKFDYKDAADRNNAQISYESIPGQTSSHLPEMFNAPMQQQIEYHAATLKAFLDDDGYDIIAKEFGIVSPGRFEAPGYFEGKVSPGSQMEVIAPRQYGVSNKLDAARKALNDRVRAEGRKKTPEEVALLNSQLRDIRYKVEPAVEDLISVYSAVVGTLLKQDGVGWHRPWFEDSVAKRDLNGVEVRIGRPFTEAETARLAKILVDVTGHEDYNPIGAEVGVRIINFDYLGVENREFQSQVAKALESMEFEDNVGYVAEPFAAQTGYFENNWKENPNGERYLDRALGGQPDLQRRVRTIIEEIQPRIDAIDAEFATKYGWTRNEQINSAHRRGDSDVEGRLALQQDDGVNLMGFDSIADMLRAGVKFFSGSKPEEAAESEPARPSRTPSSPSPIPTVSEGERIVGDTHVSPGRTPETKEEIARVQRRISIPVHDTTFTEEMAAEDARIDGDYDGELAKMLAEIDTVRAEVESGFGSMTKLTESAEKNFRFQALMEEATRRMIAAKSGDGWTDGGQAYDILERLTLAYAEGGSEQGRAFASRRAIDPSLSPAARREKELLAIVASLIKEKASKNPGKSKNATDVLNKLAKQDFDINDIAGIAADPMRSIEFLNQMRAASASWGDGLYEYWRNSLLSGFQTQAVNMAGTAGFMSYVSMFERAAAAAAGTAARPFHSALGTKTGYDAATFREFGWMFHGMGDAFKNAFRNASMTWRAERSEFDTLNNQSHRVRDYYSGQKGGAIAAGSPKISGTAGKLIRMIGFRPAAAVDDLLKTLAQHFETNALAARIAAVDTGQKWGSPEFLEVFNEQLLHPNSMARRLATERAMTGAFQGDEGILMRGSAGKLSQKLHESGVGRWFHPFHKTPLNITDEALKRAPVLGFVVDVMDYRNRKIKREAAGKPFKGFAEDGLTDSLARQAVALTVSALLLSMNDEEEPWITGAQGGIDSKKRQLAYASGYAPMTIGVGRGYRVSYARVEPLATVLGAFVDIKSSWARGEDVGTMAVAPISSAFNQLSDKTFLRGMSDIVQLFENIGKEDGGGMNALANFGANFASTWVPNMHRQASREYGGTIDETKLWGKGSVLKTLQRAGQKAELPFVAPPRPRYDQWGGRSPGDHSEGAR